MVAEDAGLGVGRHQDGADGLDSGGIGRHQLLPQTALPGLQIQLIDAGRQFARLIDVKGVIVAAEGDGLLAGVEAGNGTRFASAVG